MRTWRVRSGSMERACKRQFPTLSANELRMSTSCIHCREDARASRDHAYRMHCLSDRKEAVGAPKQAGYAENPKKPHLRRERARAAVESAGTSERAVKS